jgi:hypothetical protein
VCCALRDGAAAAAAAAAVATAAAGLAADTLLLLLLQVGYGQFAMRNLSTRIFQAYFKNNPKLFEEIYGFPVSQ